MSTKTKYRMLKEGEKIRKGDQVREVGSRAWKSLMVGAITILGSKEFRRPIKPAKK